MGPSKDDTMCAMETKQKRTRRVASPEVVQPTAPAPATVAAPAPALAPAAIAVSQVKLTPEQMDKMRLSTEAIKAAQSKVKSIPAVEGLNLSPAEKSVFEGKLAKIAFHFPNVTVAELSEVARLGLSRVVFVADQFELKARKVAGNDKGELLKSVLGVAKETAVPDVQLKANTPEAQAKKAEAMQAQAKLVADALKVTARANLVGPAKNAALNGLVSIAANVPKLSSESEMEKLLTQVGAPNIKSFADTVRNGVKGVKPEDRMAVVDKLRMPVPSRDI